MPPATTNRETITLSPKKTHLCLRFLRRPDFLLTFLYGMVKMSLFVWHETINDKGCFFWPYYESNTEID